MKKFGKFKKAIALSLLFILPLGVFAQASCHVNSVQIPGLGTFYWTECNNPAGNTNWWVYQ